MPHTLMILDPGHFHAAMPLRVSNPDLARDVHVFAPAGPGLDRFLAQVDKFNRRSDAPTDWHLIVRTSADPLADLLARRPGDVAILAGRNQGKLARIAALVRSDIHVLADKPWVVEPEDAAYLESIVDARVHAADLMTERYEPGSMLFAALAMEASVVGTADASRGPVIEKETIHHLAKEVDGVPLVRPEWYFDTSIQGEGLVDVSTHLVDQILLIAGAKNAPLTDAEVTLLGARRWKTDVPEVDFRSITGASAFPASFASRIGPGGLELQSNGQLDFLCRGLHARVRVEWRLRCGDDAGDRHCSRFHGERADIILEGTGSGGSHLRVIPRRDAASVRRALESWAAARTGLSIEDRGDGLIAKPDRWSAHHEHFELVLAGFLRGLNAPQPQWERALLRTRYRLLADALVRSRSEP